METERAEFDFLHCRTCDDYDLCQACFSGDGHGHHPKHEFEPAVAGTTLPESIRMKLRPGRNQVHQAICDGCNKVSLVFQCYSVSTYKADFTISSFLVSGTSASIVPIGIFAVTAL
jgi:hypothetical protein